MQIAVPAHVEHFLKEIDADKGTEVAIREQLTMGKSGAFVAIVDCTGKLDGIHVMKVDARPNSWDAEEVRHRRAISDGAFSGRIPGIALSVESDKYYCLLIKLAGQSRISWRPLVADSRLFCSAYKKFSEIAWTPDLFSYGKQQEMREVLASILDYKLVSSAGGRIHKHIHDFISPNFVTSPMFILYGKLLPNPAVFAASRLDLPLVRPLLGPTHGDCHSQNLFVKAGENGDVIDISLIDFATYQTSIPWFFDHAYFELATLLRALDGLGLARWLKLVDALASDDESAQIDPSERGWLQDILSARRTAWSLAQDKYPDRQDDLKLQILLAQIGAGLAFLHKMPRRKSGSGGITASQYLQSFVWSAVYASKIVDLTKTELVCLFPGETAIPFPVGQIQGPRPEVKIEKTSLRFDDSSFNVLILGNSLEKIPHEIAAVSWSLVVDFRSTASSQEEQEANPRMPRQIWPGEDFPDFGILQRGCIWLYANGRADISGAEPTKTASEWRRRYKRYFDDLTRGIAELHSPRNVRCVVMADGLSEQIVRMIIESLDMEFGEALAPIVVADSSPDTPLIDGVATHQIALDILVAELAANKAASSSTIGDALLPQRSIGEMRLVPPPESLLNRVERDLTVLYRARAQRLPKGREFGVDFRRGMPIEWAEIAQQLDVPRETAFDTYCKKVAEALEASSNRTVNLFHEPSAGGTTLSRRIAWAFMEIVPTVFIEQMSTDTASYLRDLFQFSSLPVLVVIESSVVTETEREGLLQQLREDNTRAVFLAVTRTIKKSQSDDVLSGTLNNAETEKFLEAYLEQVEDLNRQGQLRELASHRTPDEQRSPFFFGLTAFGENFQGAQKLIDDVVAGADSPVSKELLVDLALASYYNSEGFPENEYDELCAILNNGKQPVNEQSLFLIRSNDHVRVSHVILAKGVLARLARNSEIWRADIARYSRTLLDHLSRLERNTSKRVQRMVQALFISRDFESSILADVDASVGGITNKRFSQLINDIGSAEVARTILFRVSQLWPREPHYAAHLARHLMYEEPKDIDAAIMKARVTEKLPGADRDSALIHVAGMAFRIRMEQVLKEAISQGGVLATIETKVQSDFFEAVERFEKSTQVKPSNEHGLVATIQTVSIALRNAMRLSGADNLSGFLNARSSRFYMEALSLAEEKIDLLNNRQRLSARSEKTIAEWNNVYGNVDRVVSDLRALAARHEDLGIRRALCAAIVARARHKWGSMSQGDLRTVALMMEKNINQQGVSDADIRRWFSAFRHLDSFDEAVAIQRCIDWHGLSPKSVEPVYYLFCLNFLRFLGSNGSREGLAREVNRWIGVCQKNRPYGSRSWSYDWLARARNGIKLAHFKNDLAGFDPPSLIKGERPEDLAKLETRLARLEGVFRGYKGPQFATIDLGYNVFAKITPLDRLSKDDEGRRISAFISFSYDGLIGWDPRLLKN